MGVIARQLHGVLSIQGEALGIGYKHKEETGGKHDYWLDNGMEVQAVL